MLSTAETRILFRNLFDWTAGWRSSIDRSPSHSCVERGISRRTGCAWSPLALHPSALRGLLQSTVPFQLSIFMSAELIWPLVITLPGHVIALHATASVKYFLHSFFVSGYGICLLSHFQNHLIPKFTIAQQHNHPRHSANPTVLFQDFIRYQHGSIYTNPVQYWTETSLLQSQRGGVQVYSPTWQFSIKLRTITPNCSLIALDDSWGLHHWVIVKFKILKFSNDVVYLSELLGFWTLFIVQNFKKQRTQRLGK